jgi:hypothetical protein
MRLRAFFLKMICLALIMISNACKNLPQPDACCVYSHVASTANLGDGQGALQVQGSTSSYYYVIDENGKKSASALLNETLNLDAGQYNVNVNNSVHQIMIEAGILSTCSTGTLIVSGNSSESYYVTDSLDNGLSHAVLGNSISLFPGNFQIKVNSTAMAVEVKVKQLTEIRTGSLIVHGTTNEYYYVLDDTNKQLNHNTLGKPLAFLPGEYLLKVNNTSMKAHVYAGQATELNTGNLLVNGLTEEYYYVTDTLGNALNYQTLNKPLAFFPGQFVIAVNNTAVAADVVEGQTTEFATGSLMLTGGGTGYYYVMDDTGNQLNYNSLNRSLSFFPSEYTIKLGSSTRKATVAAGELTSINAFN